jgi:hypothetical protein
MPTSIVDFFPADADLPFREINTGAVFTLQVRVRPHAAGRAVELTPVPDQSKGLFFDRLTARAGALEINRVKLGAQALTPRPPLVITPDDRRNRVDDLLPDLVGAFPAGNPPYDGTVVAKQLSGAAGADAVWTIKIHSRSVPQRNLAIRWGFILSSRLGFLFQMGDVYGVWFIYQRTDAAASDFDGLVDDFRRNFLQPGDGVPPSP